MRSRYRNPNIVRLESGRNHGRAFMLLTPQKFGGYPALMSVLSRLCDRGGRGIYCYLEDGTFAVYVVFPQGVDFGPSYLLDVAGNRTLYVTTMRNCDVGAVRAILNRDKRVGRICKFGSEVYNAQD